nr:hypothetical protein BgiMline_016346 [Biomphalaria glabrata]
MSVMTFIESRPTVKLVYIFALANLALVQRSYASNDSEATSSYESCPYVNFEWKRPVRTSRMYDGKDGE